MPYPQSEYKTALEEIAKEFDEIYHDDLNQSEKNVVKVLIREGFIKLRENEFGKQVETIIF